MESRWLRRNATNSTILNFFCLLIFLNFFSFYAICIAPLAILSCKCLYEIISFIPISIQKKIFCWWCINLIITRITLISFYFLLFYLYLDGCTKVEMYYFEIPALIELEGLRCIAVLEFFIYCPLLWAPAVPSINHHVLFHHCSFRYTCYSRDSIFNLKLHWWKKLPVWFTHSVTGKLPSVPVCWWKQMELRSFFINYLLNWNINSIRRRSSQKR